MGPFERYEDNSFWRRVAIAIWNHPRDPQIYAPLEIDARPVQRVIEAGEREHGVELTPTHFVSQAIHAAGEACPQMNGVITRGKLQVRDTIDVWYNVAFDGEDLFGAKVDAVGEKSVLDVKRELDARADRIRELNDEQYHTLERFIRWVPDWLLGPFIRIADALNFTLNLPLTWAGIDRDPWGSAMVTNLATFDLEMVHVPIPPLFRMPAVFAVGKIRDKVVAEDGKPVVRPMLPVAATLDHRYLSGAEAATLKDAFCGYMEDEARLRRDAGLEPVPAPRTDGHAEASSRA